LLIIAMAKMKKIRAGDLKTPAIALGVLILLFYLFNNVLMPRYVQQGKTTTVPNVVGKTLEAAVQELAAVGLPGKKADTRTDKQYPEGTVVVQNPPAGSEVKFGRGIYLTVSGGEPLVVVPGLRGKTLRDATFALEGVGLVLGAARYEVSEEYPQGTIIDQDTPENTKVPSGRVINVVVSQGRSSDQVPVPDVTGKTFSEAEKIVIQAGLRIGNITYKVNADLLPNTVMDQYPKAGELVP
jgi:eukaryotic-like serine/threonine-protein kinase